MDRDTLTVILDVLAFSYFCESLYTALLLLLAGNPVVAPRLPETPLLSFINCHNDYSQADCERLVVLGQERYMRNPPLHDVTRYIGYGSATPHTLDVPKATLLPPHLANSGSIAWPSASLNVKMDTQCPRAIELQCHSHQPPSNISRMASYVSVWLATLQALLGAVVAAVVLVWQFIEVTDCQVLTVLVIAGFAIGITLIFLVCAAQAYIVSGGLAKAIYASIVGIVLNSATLAIFAANAVSSHSSIGSNICHVDFRPDVKWVTYLPIVSSSIMVLLSVNSSVLYLSVAHRLYIKSKCSVLRELYNVMRIYRGIGWMFISGLLSALASVIVLVFVAVGSHDIGLCWLIQWTIMSRMLTVSLWHRLYTDSTAHKR